MSDDRDPITIAGLVVPYAVHGRWGVKTDLTESEVEAFAAGYAGHPPPGLAGATTADWISIWHRRGAAFAEWEAPRRQAEERGRAAYVAGRPCKAPRGEPSPASWRRGWQEARLAALAAALPGRGGGQ